MRCLLPPTAPEHVCDIRRRTVQVASPAAGADWSVQAPNAEAWSIRALTATFTTSAVVANRGARLEMTDQNVRIAEFQPSQVVAATLAMRFGLVIGGPTGSNAVTQAAQWPGPDPFLLPPGYVLRTSTINIDVGDQWSEIALDVIFELNRGAGAAKRYAAWVKSQEAALPADRLAAGDPYRG